MITLYVKVSGELRTYETPFYANEAHGAVEYLRKQLQGTLPANTRITPIGPVLALINPSVKKYEQFTFGF